MDKEKGPAMQGLQELGAGANQIEQSDCRFFSGRAPLRRWAKYMADTAYYATCSEQSIR